LQALKPLKRDDEQPGDSEDGNEVHLVDPPSKKFKERHERFQKSKKPTPEAALIPNLLKQIMEMQDNLSLNQRTLMVLSSFIHGISASKMFFLILDRIRSGI
jgi:hypothetical protein